MKKKLFKNIMTFPASCVLGVTGCSDSTQAYNSGERIAQKMPQTAPMQQSQEINEDKNDTEPTVSESAGILDNSMLAFAQVHSANSSVSIIYPVFLDSKVEELNLIIYRKAREVGQIDTALFSPDAVLAAEHKSTVTLKNSKIVSIIFWGGSSVDNSPDKITNLVSIDVDLQSMRELTLDNLHTTNEDFKKASLEKAFLPKNPITSYDKELFHNMLQL